MKKRRYKIGMMRHKPFPVVVAQLRPANGGDDGTRCGAQSCRSLISGPRALFWMRLFLAPGDVEAAMQVFTDEEANQLLWEKAYRSQCRGEEGPDIGYLTCAQCATRWIARHLGGKHKEQEAAIAVASSVTTGLDMILFDRNLTRERNYPALAIGTFDSLAQFREQYWGELEREGPRS